jgi:DsbC/DsbD-like thiol-disulfide interchange protein
MKTLCMVASLVLGSSLWALEAVQHLTVEGVKAVELRASSSAEIVLELKVKEGFHVQANPASKPNLIATKVDLTAAREVEVGKAIYPKAKPYKVAGLDTMVGTYDKRFDVKIPVQATAKITPGTVVLEGRIKYQACDDKVCFPPTIAKFTASIKVVK